MKTLEKQLHPISSDWFLASQDSGAWDWYKREQEYGHLFSLAHGQMWNMHTYDVVKEEAAPSVDYWIGEIEAAIDRVTMACDAPGGAASLSTK